MALTIRRKSGLIVPKTPTLILSGKEEEESLTERIVKEEIQRILKETVGVRTRIKIRRIEFIPIYARRSGVKEITKIYLKQKNNLRETVIEASEIEASGVSLLEFFDYIITAGAKEIQDPVKALEIM